MMHAFLKLTSDMHKNYYIWSTKESLLYIPKSNSELLFVSRYHIPDPNYVMQRDVESVLGFNK